MKFLAAAIQMSATLSSTDENLQAADAYLRRAHEAGVEFAVLPELFHTGYCRSGDYARLAETTEGRTAAFLSDRSRAFGMAIAAGFAEWDSGHLYNAIYFCTPGGQKAIYRKRNLVLWERRQFCPGRSALVVKTAWGRIGFAICADMIYHRVWKEYRETADLIAVSSAWPEFRDERTGKRNWLLGPLGTMAGQIPVRASEDLGVPVIFANLCGPTRTTLPVFQTTFPDRFVGQSCVCDSRREIRRQAGFEAELVIAPMTIPRAGVTKTWVTMSPSALAASSSGSAHALHTHLGPLSTGGSVRNGAKSPNRVESET